MASSRIVGFIGLDELCLELVSPLISSGFRVQGFEEVDARLMGEFVRIGGVRCDSPVEAAGDASTLIVVASLNDKVPLFFQKELMVKGLQKDVLVLLWSTLPPNHIDKLLKSLIGELDETALVGIHVFKGVSGAFNGKIIATAFGNRGAIHRVTPILSTVSAKLYAFEGEVDGGSKFRMVNELLEGLHLVASVEAIYLGVRAGIHPSILYDIISNAAGNSWIFTNIVPKLLSADESLASYLSTLVKRLLEGACTPAGYASVEVNSRSRSNKEGLVMDTAKALTFPLPLLSIAYQQLIGSLNMHKENHLAELNKAWDNMYGANLIHAAKVKYDYAGNRADQLSISSFAAKKIGFIGLGAMGFGMATHLLRSNFCILAYDVYKPTLSRFQALGGMVGASPEEVSKDVEALIVMVANEAQAESVLFGDAGSVSALPAGASVILSSTVSPAFVKRIEQLIKAEGKSLKLVDAPVSGGVKRAAEGALTIMASGTDEALACTASILSALSEKLYFIEGSCGAASSVKMVNQLLAGVHIASAAEAMAFGARLGLNTRLLFEIVNHGRGYSWMFENRVPHMLDNDYTPYSAIDIFVKDLGIVSAEGSSLKMPHHISAAAHQLFLSGSASGWGRLDDAAVVKVYETLTGVRVQGKLSILNKENVLKSLPPEWPDDPIEDLHTLEHHNGSKVLVVLDDDPTGTQTVHDIEVLTEWKVETLVEQFGKNPSCFFILTNSRSLSSEKAALLTKDICRNIEIAAKSKGINYTIVLRGDSTLRGHFPEEADAVVSVLGEMDAWIICPFFFQGGRYTIDDIHYVADSDGLVPAGETEFSKDAAFGYKSSNLREWVEEKTKGRITASGVASVSISLLRTGGPAAVCDLLCSLQKGSTCIVNAASERDVAVFAVGMIQAERKGRRFLCRTAASFVSARMGIRPKPPIRPSDLGLDRKISGGLIVVGSYVPKTTRQIEELKSQLGHLLKCIEISVDKLALKSVEEREEEINRAAEMANALLSLHKDTLLMTSRQLITGKSPLESLEINYKVSSALVEIVRRIHARPRYILAKGGITSSDLATKALEAQCATVIGQALAGVPLWLLGPESRHPGVPYIVFPGNVGDNNALADVVKSWNRPPRSSTKDLLLNAEKGGYAVGAFNVYNLEGVEAVIAAAEAENSPAILQVHPGALKFGGLPLVTCCISAAEQARVPITVHFDHGSSKTELVEALELGFDSVMVDGSHLPLKENISDTKYISSLAHSKGMLVEAELGRLSGTEDDLTVKDYEAKLTDATQAEGFIDETGIDALAVCIGNVHGKYPAGGPNLRLDLLKDLHALTSRKGVSLVLHGASGLPSELIKECIELGVRKFNVNTEVRNAYLGALQKPNKDVIHVMGSAKEAMKVVIAEKLRLFGSSGKA